MRDYNKCVVGLTYADTNEPIQAGDQLFVDGHPGRVVAVVLAGTQEAESWYCEETGGLVIEFERFGRTVVPLGSLGVVTQKPADSRSGN